jgi:hypothetical protein
MAAVTVANLVQRIRTVLNDYPLSTKLATTISSTGTTSVIVTTGEGARIDATSILEFQDDGEQCYITSMSTDTATVVRGYNGTTAASSHTSGVEIRVNPTFSYKQVTDAVSATIETLWPYVWKKATLTITPSTTKAWYDLDVNVMDLIQVSQKYNTASTPIRIFFYGARGKTYPVGVFRGIDSSVVTSGVGLYLPYRRDDTNSIYADVRKKITDGGTTSYDDIVDTSVSNQELAAEMLVAGAVARMLAAHDIARSSMEDIPQGDKSVRPGVRTQLSAYWHNRFIELRHQLHAEQMLTMSPMKKAGQHGSAVI